MAGDVKDHVNSQRALSSRAWTVLEHSPGLESLPAVHRRPSTTPTYTILAPSYSPRPSHLSFRYPSPTFYSNHEQPQLHRQDPRIPPSSHSARKGLRKCTRSVSKRSLLRNINVMAFTRVSPVHPAHIAFALLNEAQGDATGTSPPSHSLFSSVIDKAGGDSVSRSVYIRV